ncbi:VCBS repeat-containing protein, partial [bacterium]|nr:VCBS repeat-containing protein [bacterium]
MKFFPFLALVTLFAPVKAIEGHRLNKPNSSEGTTMFDRLDAERTGIDFTREWKPPVKWVAEISGSFTGGGVCLGDFDRDGDTDLFLSRMTDGGRLYRNLGDFKFEDVTEEMGMASPGLWGAGCTWADVDGDGWLDLYLCAFDGPNRLFINQAGKGFQDQAVEQGLAFKGASLMMAFSDYDRDGDLDGYLLTNRIPPGEELKDVRFRLVKGPDGEPVILPEEMQQYAGLIKSPSGYKQIASGQFDRLYRNEGGKFVEVGKEAGVRESEYGLSATWWDYDADGWPDLYVANDFYGADHLYRNKGDGTFEDVAPRALPHTPWFSMGSDVADINNDGLFDYMASDMAGSDHYKEKMSMGN